MQKQASFSWTDECQQAFDILKQKLTSSPVLTYPDPSRKFILDTDASDTGIGATLSQVDDQGREQVIAYASSSLSKSQRRYGTTRREMYAVVFFVQYFKHYLLELVPPTRSTRFLPNLTLDWLTTATRSTPGARRTFRSANLKESTTPCSIHSVSGNSPLISWAWVGWGRLCLKSTTYILLSRPNHHQGYKLTETLCFQRDKHLVKPQVAAWVRVAHGVVLNRRWEPV